MVTITCPGLPPVSLTRQFPAPYDKWIANPPLGKFVSSLHKIVSSMCSACGVFSFVYVAFYHGAFFQIHVVVW